MTDGEKTNQGLRERDRDREWACAERERETERGEEGTEGKG